MLAGLSLPSCLSVEERPLEAEQVTQDVSSRSEDPVPAIKASLELFEEVPLGLKLPDSLDPTRDAGRDVFWHAHALAFAPVVRAARRTLRASWEEVNAAGRPEALKASYQMESFSDPSQQQGVVATVDLLRWLGFGTSAAENTVAQQLVGVAIGELEVAVWRAVFAVDDARVRLVTAQEEEAVLQALATEAEEDWRRIELLRERGWIGEGLHGRGQAVLRELWREHSLLEARTAAAREELAIAAGLSPDAPALEAVTLSAPRDDDPVALPDSGALFERLPELRRARRDYALAEAELRLEAAASWPTLRAGSAFKILPDDVLTGGVISFETPWPGVASARVEAAQERREAARERVEDALSAALARAQSRRQQLILAHEHRVRDVAPQLEGSASALRAARACLSVHETTEVVEVWLDALGLRSRAVLEGSRATRRELLADLDYREAVGERPGLDSRIPVDEIETRPSMEARQ